MSCFAIGDNIANKEELANIGVEAANTTKKINYVSLGDSIAAGYRLTDHSEAKEYGNGASSTPMLEESYSYKVYNDLVETYGVNNVNKTSYAKTGATIEWLLSRLEGPYADGNVISSIQNADIITISIGANNVLAPGVNDIMGFVQANPTVSVQQKLDEMDAGLNQARANFPQLLAKLEELNSKAQVSFVMPYNPYRGFGFKDAFIELFTLDVEDIVRYNIRGDLGPEIEKWTEDQAIALLKQQWREDLQIPIGFNESVLLQHLLDVNRINIIGEVAGIYLAGGSTVVEGHNINISADASLCGIIKNEINKLNNNNFSMVDIYNVFGNIPLSNPDLFRGGPSGSRNDIGAVNAWFGQENGFIDSILTAAAGADWDAADKYAYDKVVWKGVEFLLAGRFNNPTEEEEYQMLFELAVVYYTNFLEYGGVSVEDEIARACDPHPTRKGQGIIYEQIKSKYGLVKFDSNGGDCDYIGDVGEVGKQISKPADPKMSGYRLVGWFKDETYQNEWNFDSDVLPSEPVTLYAKWEIPINKVTLDNQGATTAGTANYWYIFEYFDRGIYYYTNAECTEGLVESKITTPTKEAWIFKGYYTEPDGEGQQYVNENGLCVNNLYRTVNEDVTLYAHWAPILYTIRFESNGGSSVNAIDVQKLELLPKPENPTKYDFIFDGWYTDEELTNQWDFYNDTITSDLTLYARWTQIVCDDNLKNQYSGNLQNIGFSIDITEGDIKWFIDGVEQEGEYLYNFMFRTETRNFGKTTVHCEVDGVVSNKIDIMIYQDLQSLKIGVDNYGLFKQKFAVLDTDLTHADTGRIFWYKSTGGIGSDDELLGTGTEIILEISDPCEIYAVYRAGAIELKSNIIKKDADIRPYYIYIAAGGGSVVLLGISIGIGIKIKKSRKRIMMGKNIRMK